MAQVLSPKVVLVCMPWATTTRPSLALGILGSLCREQQVPVRTFYPNLDLSAIIGFEAAGRLANERALYGLSEHLFACDIFGVEALSSDEYIATLGRLAMPKPFDDVQFIRWLRDEVVKDFLTQVEERVLGEQPTIVGVSSTFNQVMSSLALGRRVKRRRPEVQVLAGGACFDGEMGQEYHRGMPSAVDHVFMGEAEDSFREYLRRQVAGQSCHGIPGVTYFADGEVQLVPGAPLQQMDQSPMPDYDDFFAEQRRVQESTGRVFNIEYLPFESSRGCWWGQKNHCVFCGINPSLMSFREKGLERTLGEMVKLSARYGVVNLTAADWIISRKTRADLFRRLADLDLDIECFYETRADLSKEEFALMRKAGIVKIQPGIESLSTELLQLMKKGTTRIRHVQFLRWAREYQIHLSYNLLGGFPGEQVEWYHEMAEFIPRIRHLQPPLHNMHFVEMHRFSPLFELRERFGVDEFQIRADYGFNFPPGLVDLQKIGYFFSFSCNGLVDREAYAPRLREVVGSWIEAHERRTPPIYHYILGPGFTRIVDTRQGEGRYLQLSGLHQDIFLLCDAVQTPHKLRDALQPLYPAEVAAGAVERIIDELVQDDLVMRENQSLLALPIGYRQRSTAELRSYVLGEFAALAAAPDQPAAPRLTVLQS